MTLQQRTKSRNANIERGSFSCAGKRTLRADNASRIACNNSSRQLSTHSHRTSVTQATSTFTVTSTARKSHVRVMLLPRPVRRRRSKVPRAMQLQNQSERLMWRQCYINTPPHTTCTDFSSTTLAQTPIVAHTLARVSRSHARVART